LSGALAVRGRQRPDAAALTTVGRACNQDRLLIREMAVKRLRALSSPISGMRALGYGLSLPILAGVTAALLSGFFLSLRTLGAHDWDQMESHRYLVVKSIRDFAQFPFWDPYGCGGFPAWGAPESATIVVSPFLPVYLSLSLPAAIRFEVTALFIALVAGCWFFARRYVRSPLAIAFVCLVAGLNSRAALQAAAGHTWHLYYAGMPWVLGAFDRASASETSEPDRRLLWLSFGAFVLAMMIYGGGIYPVPHTAICLLGLGAYRAWAQQKVRPLLVAVALAAWGALLAMPKLLPIAETMALFPRLVRSRETIDPRLWIRLFLSSANDFPKYRAGDLDYLWHEYGQYVGLGPLALIVWANLRKLPPEPALRSLRFVGWGLTALALGGWGPWILLHWAPLFRSQHVPSRFTYPAFFLFAPVAANFGETQVAAWLLRTHRPAGRVLLRAVVGGAFVFSAVLIAREDARCTRPWFGIQVPDTPERQSGFVQYSTAPAPYDYGDGDPNSPRGTRGEPGLLVRRANVGSIRCETAFLSNTSPKREDGRPVHFGARGLGDPSYQGEYWLQSEGSVELLRWSPNEVSLSVRGAHAGELVLLNQNWAPGWSANGAFTINFEDVNGYRLAASTETVTFRYRPRTLPWALALGALGAAMFPGIWLVRRRGRHISAPTAGTCSQQVSAPSCQATN